MASESISVQLKREIFLGYSPTLHICQISTKNYLILTDLNESIVSFSVLCCMADENAQYDLCKNDMTGTEQNGTELEVIDAQYGCGRWTRG